MEKILILRGGALGDFIVTLPVLATLRARWPRARIELAGNATAAELAQRDGLLDAIHSQHEAHWSALYQPGPLPETFARWLAIFDLVVSYWPDPTGDLAAHFPLRPTQRLLTAPAHPTINPAAAHYLSALAPLGFAPSDHFYRFQFTAAIRPVPGRIALHPGSGSARKNWPLVRWAELCDWLRQRPGIELCLITGEAEPPAALQLRGPATSWHQLPLPALAERLASCEFFIGHDSGISHLAAALNVPALLLFGPTEPACWAPPSPRVRVLRVGSEVAAISPAAVQAALSAALPGRF